MAEKKLARNVTVAGKTYGPGDDVPAEIAEQIRNPKAWIALDEAAVEEVYASKQGGTSAGDRLASSVTVGGRTYGPNDFVPDEVAAQIRNPKAWVGGKVPSPVAKATADADADKPKPALAPEALPEVPVADTRAGRGGRRG